MNIPINTVAFWSLLPAALLIPLCAWAGFRLASLPKRRGARLALSGLIIMLLALDTAWNLLMLLRTALSTAIEDGDLL